MTEQPKNESKPAAGPRREFSFSRIAGASPGDYAAVSSSAVAAVIVALLGVLAMAFVWGPVLAGGHRIALVDPAISLGLAFPAAIALLLAGLASWYIVMSAETLTGLKVAATAAAIALLSGGSAVALHLTVRQQRQADIETARELAGQFADLIAAADYDAAYEQLDESYRQGVPLSHWRYQWTRFFDVRGSARRVELSDRSMFAPTGQVMVNLHIHLPVPGGSDASEAEEERVVTVRLVYGPAMADDHDGHEHTGHDHDGHDHAGHDHAGYDHGGHGIGSHRAAGSARGQWRLVNLPGLITPLPPPYAEPLIWPAPGPLVLAVRNRGQDVPTVWLLPAGTPVPTTRPDEELAVMAQPPLVPPRMFERPWLTVRPPPPPSVHRH